MKFKKFGKFTILEIQSSRNSKFSKFRKFNIEKILKIKKSWNPKKSENSENSQLKILCTTTTKKKTTIIKNKNWNMGQYWFSFLFLIIADNLIIDEAESVSPPSTPLSVGIRLISASENENLNENSQSSSKRAKKSVENDDFNSGLLTGSVLDGYRFIEKFNRDMMDQFLDYQRRVAASQIRWEQERYRQEQLAIGIID